MRFARENFILKAVSAAAQTGFFGGGQGAFWAGAKGIKPTGRLAARGACGADRNGGLCCEPLPVRRARLRQNRADAARRPCLRACWPAAAVYPALLAYPELKRRWPWCI